jgi:hypothetical protein
MRVRMPFMGSLVYADAKVKANQAECNKGTKEFTVASVESSSLVNRVTVPSSQNSIVQR